MRTKEILIGCLIAGQFLSGEPEVVPFLSSVLEDHISVRDLTIRFDGKEAYLSSQSLYGEVSAIIRIDRIDGQWMRPEIASFSGQHMDLEPFLSPDGLRLYFASSRPAKDNDDQGDFDIWYVQRTDLDQPWSDPVNLGSPVNTPGNEFYPAVTADGDLYYTSDGEGSMGKDDIFMSEYRKDSYSKPRSLGNEINSEGYEFNAFVPPDGSFIIFTAYNREGGHGSGDLYISRQNQDGEWAPSENLGQAINSDRMDYCPFVDERGNLYFTSKRAQFPEPPYGASSVREWAKLIGKGENGQSRLYLVNEFFKAGE